MGTEHQMRVEPKSKIIVVGGGLAGLSAACRALAQGAHVTLIEKNVLGGNSAKATSGINSVNSKFQKELILKGLVNDSLELFQQDTLKAGHFTNKVELVETLALLSGEAVDSLSSEFGLNLSDVQQLGGHSARRTHRFPAHEGRVAPVGFTIIAIFKKKFLQYVDAGEAELLQRTAVTDFRFESENDSAYVAEVTLKDLASNTSRTLTDCTALILAAGGYAADSSPESVLASNRPDLLGFPTTNGEFASGDMIRIGMKRGLATLHLDEVQLHPTGFIDPKDPKNTRKFLCPEVMRGVGSILLDVNGDRFVDELSPRDKVAQAIIKHGGSLKEWQLSDQADKQKVALLILSHTMAEKFGLAAFNFYKAKGFFFEIDTDEALKRHAPTIKGNVLRNMLQEYDLASRGEREDCCGKTVFPQPFDLQVSSDTKLYGAFVTPALHFTMGGLEIDSSSRALMKDNRQPVRNLFVAGETAGGVHGKNRLGGNGCLESLVFGRLSGTLAAKIH